MPKLTLRHFKLCLLKKLKTSTKERQYELSLMQMSSIQDFHSHSRMKKKKKKKIFNKEKKRGDWPKLLADKSRLQVPAQMESSFTKTNVDTHNPPPPHTPLCSLLHASTAQRPGL